jgi:iron-sulfur cluster repair protein YtfE (RIC family)
MKDTTNTPIDATMTVNEAVRLFPATVSVFAAAGIDSCCGGALPIAEAARRHGIEPDQLLRQLEASAEQP